MACVCVCAHTHTHTHTRTHTQSIFDTFGVVCVCASVCAKLDKCNIKQSQDIDDCTIRTYLIHCVSVCLSVCVCVCVCLCLSVYACVCAYVHVYICICVYVSVYTSVWLYTYMYVCMYVCMCMGISGHHCHSELCNWCSPTSFILAVATTHPPLRSSHPPHIYTGPKLMNSLKKLLELPKSDIIYLTG